MKIKFALLFILFYGLGFSQTEKHFKNLKQLTFGGDNAEAYWSFDSKKLTFQSNYTKWNLHCDQIFSMDIAKAAKDSLYKPALISTGKGRTTCSYFLPGNKKILYASTHAANDSCPAPPAPRSDGKYLWPVYKEYDIYVADLSGKIISQLTNTNGYDAEATVSPKGDKIVFTSDRSGDMELWTMDIDGKNQKQITTGLGYDGGAFFSPDGKKLVFRASRPQTEEDKKEYKELLAQGLVSPTKMEIYTCNVDGSDLKQITTLGKANWAPFFTPDGKQIIFSSNHNSKKGYDFQLWLINIDGTGLEQVTTESVFNSFAMFSPDGKKISFSSNRKNHGTRDTNVFVAEWVK
ncbi:MAG: PD40 domain-containing protein [Bacteroidia bacterium]|nr:PD40 domain-containing protein [Bacteroidia bacterium]